MDPVCPYTCVQIPSGFRSELGMGGQCGLNPASITELSASFTKALYCICIWEEAKERQSWAESQPRVRACLEIWLEEPGQVGARPAESHGPSKAPTLLEEWPSVTQEPFSQDQLHSSLELFQAQIPVTLENSWKWTTVQGGARQPRPQEPHDLLLTSVWEQDEQKPSEEPSRQHVFQIQLRHQKT